MTLRVLRTGDRSPALRRAVLAALLTLGLALLAGPGGAPATRAEGGSSLRFYGTGPTDVDRVKIPLGPLNSNGQLTGSRPVNVGGDFTVEFWMKAPAGVNDAPGCGGTGWYYGNIIIDRDVYGSDAGDYGIAICGGRIVFGVNNGSGEVPPLVGSTTVTDNTWRHIAVTRSAASGQMRIFVDGQLDATANGPTGNIAYPTGRATGYPNSDPYLVFAAEKHDYDNSRYYTGWLDDVRISSTVRYSASFTRPSAPHPADGSTVALYRFDEGGGTAVGDSSNAAGGPSGGTLRPRAGGDAQHWSADTPFGAGPDPSPSASPSTSPSADPDPSPSTSPSADPDPSPSTSPSPTPDPTCTGTATASATAEPTASGTPVVPPPSAAEPLHRLYLPFVLCLTF